jgi:hypothetical protein
MLKDEGVNPSSFFVKNPKKREKKAVSWDLGTLIAR